MMMLYQWVVLFKGLVDQGHDVHVVYQTSGNIAVSNDSDVLKFLEVINSDVFLIVNATVM